MKKCSKCEEEKELTEFNKRKDSKDGYSYHCKICINEKRNLPENKEKKKLADKLYRENNPDIIKKGKEKYVDNNRISLNKRKRNKRKNNKEIYSLKDKEYREKNKDRILINQKNHREKDIDLYREKNRLNKQKRIENDPIFKISNHIRKIILTAVKKGGYRKDSRTYEVLGCSFDELKIHIETQFKEWMNWNNHGNYTGNYNETWQYDHIIPLSSGMSEEEIITLNHYTNFQPLCSRKNLEKSNKMDYIM